MQCLSSVSLSAGELLNADFLARLQPVSGTFFCYTVSDMSQQAAGIEPCHLPVSPTAVLYSRFTNPIP
jgi:hypothetical protein